MLIRAKTLVNKTAEDLNVSPELVNDIVDFYYSELRSKMESLNHSRIRVSELGVFYMSEKKLETSINTLIHIIETAEPTTFKQIGVVNTKQNLLEQQQEALERVIKEREEYELKKDLERKK